jgi:hypothetical protein
MESVRRSLILICVIILLFDLAQDGCLGQAKFVALPTPVKSLVTFSSNHFDADHLNILAKPPPALWLAVPLHLPAFYLTPATPHSLKLIHFSYLTSFGGLPR